MLGYIDNLVSDINIKINDLLNNIQDKFGFVMPIQEVNDYINKSIVNNSNYLENFGMIYGIKDFDEKGNEITYVGMANKKIYEINKIRNRKNTALYKIIKYLF